jgi:ABC-type nitrate/sulfonate/bicarbonate transport system substrate-binding protein
MRQILTAFAFVAGLAVIAPVPTMAQVEKPKVTIGYGSMSGGFGSFWVAKEKGYFQEQGLDAELLYTRTTTGLQVLNSGQVDLVGTGCAEFFEATRKGFENRVLASLYEYNLYLIASRKEITDAKMLAGKSVAVNRIGDTGHLSVKWALRKAGVDPDSVTYVQIGSTPERFSALSSGAVAAAVQNGSLKPLVLAQGQNVLIDLQDKTIPYCLGGIATSPDMLKNNPKTVAAMMRAIVKGNAYLRDGPEAETKAIFSKYMKLPTDDKQLVESWTYFAKTVHSQKPVMTLDATKNVIAMLAEAENSWTKEDPARFIDLSLMERLDKEGYLDKVYAEIKK